LAHWPKKVTDIIDFGIIKSIAKTYFSIKASLQLSSDHSSIIINVNNSIKKMQVCVLNNKRINWDLFCEQMKSKQINVSKRP
jgi:hypothetical protein